MSVMWLVDGDFFKDRAVLAEHQRLQQAQEEAELLEEELELLEAERLAKLQSQGVPIPTKVLPSEASALAAAHESASLSAEAQRALSKLPLPPPNSEVAAQPRADLEHRQGFGQRDVDPVRAIEKSARPESHRSTEHDEPATVAELMSTKPMTVFPNDSTQVALEKLKSANIHHLPVVNEEQRLVGLVSDRDLLGREGQLSERMNTRVLTASPTTGLEEAAQALAQERFHSLVVIDEEQRPIGMLTSFDLMKFLVKHPATKLWRS